MEQETMKRHKYHPQDLNEAKQRCLRLGLEHIFLGTALIAESDEPIYPNSERPSGDDDFYFNIGYSCPAHPLQGEQHEKEPVTCIA